MRSTGTPAISVWDLRKVYEVPERESGLRASVRSLFRRQTKEVVAVAGISFEVAAGEIVGFLGPNGAGKTTTLKMLSGLLYPTAGEATVLGHVPWQREKAYLRQMTLVMGQRNQLVWDIPIADSYELNRAIYRIPEEQYRETLAELTEARADAVGATGRVWRERCERRLTGALVAVQVAAEGYPQLRASTAFRELQQQLGEVEDDIVGARRIFNSNVQRFNDLVQTFPASLVASFGSFTPRQYFDVETSAERAVPKPDVAESGLRVIGGGGVAA
jgi:energy-coupling factor transporter ATP-binding protein EcfA2